jgi:hypothetical protein
MACFVKRPQEGARGVLVITDVEYRDAVLMNAAMRSRFEALRKHWLLLVHCNSSIRQIYAHDPLVDAFIAGPGDIASTDSGALPQIVMDCSNFSPAFFAGPEAEKFWDVLFISRNQGFKSLDRLFHILRATFDEAPLRVLAIVAHTSAAELQTSEPIRFYTQMFSSEERKLFTLMTPWVDYPFCFDLPTLAHFYHRSRAFLHTAAEERHPRVVGYAWAAGLPVVAPPTAAALLPPDMAHPPGFFSFDTTVQAVAQLRKALKAPALPMRYSESHLAPFQIARFQQEIQKLYARLGLPFIEGGWELDDMDIRLARHHGIRAGANSYRASLYQFAGLLAKPLPDITGPRIEEALDPHALEEAEGSVPSPPSRGGLRRMVRTVLGRAE